jgi:hypothetical protein
MQQGTVIQSSRSPDEIKAMEVEAWLAKSRACLAGQDPQCLSVMFSACRCELFDHNSTRFVRQSAKRRRAPDVLTGAEIKVLVDNSRYASAH